MNPANIFPMYGSMLVKELVEDPFLSSEERDYLGFGEVIRVGKGIPTREGLDPHSARPGDKIIFLKDQVKPITGEDMNLYYLVHVSNTSAILDRDPMLGELDFPIDNMEELSDFARSLQNSPYFTNLQNGDDEPPDDFPL